MHLLNTGGDTIIFRGHSHKCLCWSLHESPLPEAGGTVLPLQSLPWLACAVTGVSGYPEKFYLEF